MKYVFSTFVYLPVMGGIQVYINQIANYLIKEGHEVCVITSDKKISSIVREEIDGARVIRLPAYEIGGFYFLKNKKTALAEIDTEIKNTDLVHVNAPKLLYKYFAENKKKYGYRLIATSHGWFYHTKKFKFAKDWYFRNIICKYAPLYDGIINVSFQDQDIAKSFGLNNTCVIENGVDIYKYSNLPPKKEFQSKFIYFGRIANNKGILECLKKLASYKSDFTFDVIGNCSDQQYMDKLKAYVENSGLSKKVIFWGRLSEDEIRQKLTEADIILMPSLHEGFGMALAECLLTGRPIIANDNDAFRKILQSVEAEGYLFDFENDSSNFSEKVNEVMSSVTIPQNVEQYSVKNMIKKTIDIYGI